MKQLFLSFVLIYFLISGCSEPAKNSSNLVAFSIATDSNYTTYVICKADEPISYHESGHVYTGYYVTRDVSVHSYAITDSVFVKGDGLTSQQIIAAYAHPRTNILANESKKILEETFIYLGIFKQKKISTSLTLSYYQPETKTIMATTKIYREIKKVFYFWSLLFLLIIFGLGDWIFNLIYKINKKERVFDAFALETSFTWLIFIISCVVSVNAALTHGWQFSLISLAAFLMPVPIELYKKKNEAKSIAKENARRME